MIEYIRHAVDRARAEDFSGEDEDDVRQTAQALLGPKHERDFGETKGTLLPDHEIELDMSISSRPYRVRRTARGTDVILEPDTQEARVAALDIRTLISPRILSQRQIARIARDPAAQRRELDALLADRLREFEEKRRTLLDQLATLQLTRTRLKERAQTLPARETELRKTNDQIAFLEEGGRKDTFERLQAYRREQNWIEELRREMEATAKGLEEQAAATQASRDRLSPPTHNANIPVNGDAELIVALGATARLGVVLEKGSIDSATIKDQVSVIMERARSPLASGGSAN